MQQNVHLVKDSLQKILSPKNHPAFEEEVREESVINLLNDY